MNLYFFGEKRTIQIDPANSRSPSPIKTGKPVIFRLQGTLVDWIALPSSQTMICSPSGDSAYMPCPEEQNSVLTLIDGSAFCRAKIPAPIARIITKRMKKCLMRSVIPPCAYYHRLLRL